MSQDTLGIEVEYRKENILAISPIDVIILPS